MINLHERIFQKAEITRTASVVLHLNCTALSQSKSSNFFMYNIKLVIKYENVIQFIALHVSHRQR